ncbi:MULTISPECIES: serine hydrolase domain-containing protein [Bacillus cereus group]|uniref:serine hydrolase domain-containing protein n=1 Tax=Bacillus cereus group TaxID=86661 RepID=UPI0022DEF48F|nr:MULTISPECIES: serine hydrolase domain-containing protein [unclassified Bacillus cereus group]HDR7717022.1 beta-lactamase family protein [Bacillus albus]MDA2025984.1 serine hydrolase [Bacillus cereus group sp. Bcc03]MDA2215762.1 serine hydrolase [Bacillus cereus group sp. Bc228]MDA2225862.1 serine hydrolase [Bacillus cereus group sp. Bc227]MDA2260088.1 serine hydrolase [Bacillus cereus group sp. Bc200]
MKNTIYKMSLIYILCNVLMLCIIDSKVYAQQNIEIALDKYVEKFIKEQNIPGASVAIVHKKDIFFTKTMGITGESEKKVTNKTPFAIGSISKSLTALAIVKLIQDKKLKLEDPVQRYLPWFKLKDSQISSNITIQHLLTHTSGISTYEGLALSDKQSKNSTALKENVMKLSNVKLTAPPGEKYQYSNANYIVLGALIEGVTNETYSSYMEKHIFQPLNMNGAAASKEIAYEKDYLTGYQSWFGIPRKSVVSYDNAGAPYGYITANLEDMIQFLMFLNRKEHTQFLKKENIDLYLSSLYKINSEKSYGFGLRTTNINDGEKMIWHSGSTPDARAEMFTLNNSGWSGVILTNKNHVLEEPALSVLKNGIISILNGEVPVNPPKNIPFIQIVMSIVIFALFIISIILIKKYKHKKTLKRLTWLFIGNLFLLLSIIFIPLLTYSTSSPWHTIKIFAADIALLTSIIVILLAVNGLISIFIALRRKRV